MSKASEWAEGFGRRLRFANDRARAEVTNDGNCAIENSGGGRVVELGPREVVALARWILDTFGDDAAERSDAASASERDPR